MARIQSLFPKDAYQQFGRKRVRRRTQPQTEQNRPRPYRHRPLPFPDQLFAVLTQDEPGVLVIQDRDGASPQASGFAAQSGYDRYQQVL